MRQPGATSTFQKADVFAWSYEEMPGLDPAVVVHKLAVREDVLPMKQGKRIYRPKLLPQIEAEVN